MTIPKYASRMEKHEVNPEAFDLTIYGDVEETTNECCRKASIPPAGHVRIVVNWKQLPEITIRWTVEYGASSQPELLQIRGKTPWP
ncbi:hypothetical protein FRC10_004610 [Ceratobasidium sp. 414]|nr:hypothetical protein FRC10_004610 [Ceratobasidium sp. 414]